jgi:hypothetical protein
VFRVAFVVVGVCYVAIGVAVAWFFGKRISSQCNLNWSGYVGCLPAPEGYVVGTSGAADCKSAATWTPGCVDVSARPAYATAIAYAVLLFPALDVLSAFPLNALTLGNNLMSCAFGDAALTIPTAASEAEFFASSDAPQRPGADATAAERVWHWLVYGGSSSGGESGDDGAPLLAASGGVAAGSTSSAAASGGGGGGAPFLRTRRGHRVVATLFRLLAAVPPIVVAFFVRDLGNVLEFTGLIGVAIAFLVPAMLALYSEARQRAVFAAVSIAVWRTSGGAAGAATADGIEKWASALPAAARATQLATAAAAAPPADAEADLDADARIASAAAEAAASLPAAALGPREACTHLAADEAYALTPYSGLVRSQVSRAPELLLMLSAVLGVFVAVMIVRSYAGITD